MRLIDAGVLLENMNQLIKGYGVIFSPNSDILCGCIMALDQTKRIVEDAHTIDPESLRSQWIPVTEKPAPDVYRDKEGLLIPFLISQTRCKYPTIAFYSNGNWNLGIDIVEVEAWMPLPSVYKPKDKEE